MKSNTLIIRLLGLLLIAILAGDAEAAGEMDVAGPCVPFLGCTLCKADNQDCLVMFCGDHIHTNCDFN